MGTQYPLIGPAEEHADPGDLTWFRDLLGNSHRHSFIYRNGWDWCACGSVEPVFECAP